MNKFFEKLPFRNMAEKIPAGTRAKIPLLNKIIPFANQIVCGLVVLLLVLVIVSASGGGSREEGSIAASEGENRGGASAQEGLVFMTGPLVMATTGLSQPPNLNALSRRNNQFNVVIEAGMEPSWERIKSLYGIRALPDWIYIWTEEQFNDIVFFWDNHVLFITSKSDYMNYMVTGSNAHLLFVLDPRNALRN